MAYPSHRLHFTALQQVALLALGLAAAGCRTGLDGGGGGRVAIYDLSTTAPPADLASPPTPDDASELQLIDIGAPPIDLAVPLDLPPPPPPPDFSGAVVDLAVVRDFAVTPPDLTALRDFTLPPDFTIPPDLTAPTCKDGIKNGLETDVDCGGGICAGCGGGRRCIANGDCASKGCASGICRATLSFARPASTGVVGVPEALAADDFNGDGRTDLAAAMFDSGFVGVLLNQGGGTFATQAVVYSAAGAQLLGIAAGDFNRDGKRDVATVGDGVLTLAYGRGDGSFPASATARSGGALVAVRAGDVNLDGIDDAVYLDRGVLGGGGGALYAAIAGANNTIASTPSSKSVANPDGLALGDLDGDGRLDVVLASIAWPGQYQALRGDGKGGFAAAWTGASGINPTGVVTGDWNGDGRIDFAGAQSNTDDVGAWLGSGMATFSGQRVAATAPVPLVLATADFDLDRRADLAVSCGSGPQNTVDILLGNGDGSFTSALRIPAGSGPGSIVAFDANADGKPDLAVTDSNGQRVVVLLNTSL